MWGALRIAGAIAASVIFQPKTTDIIDLDEAARPMEAEDRLTRSPAAVKQERQVKDAVTKALRENRYVVVSSPFKMVFLTVVVITLVSGASEILLAGFWITPSANQQSAFEAVGFAWKAGIGALFGLLGGKVR